MFFGSSTRGAFTSKQIGPGVFRILEDDEQREVLERLGVAEREILIVALAVLGVEVDVEELARLEAQLDVPEVIEARRCGSAPSRGSGRRAAARHGSRREMR